MKIIFAGCRDIEPARAEQLVREAYYSMPDGFDMTELVHGDAKGIDRAAARFFRVSYIPIKAFPANWSEHGKAAGPIRNREMAAYADALVAIHDGISRGTANMIAEMEKLGKPVYVFKFER